MDIKWACALGCVILLSAATLAHLGWTIDSFYTILRKEHCIAGKRQVVTWKNFLSASKVRAKLEATYRYNQESIDAIIAKQKKMIRGIVLHDAAGAIYVFIWVLWVCRNWPCLKAKAQMLFFAVLCLVVFGMFWIAPLRDFYYQKKACGSEKLDPLQAMADSINYGPTNWLTSKSGYGILFMVALCATMFVQSGYLFLLLKFVHETGDTGVDYIIALFFLIVYQYGVQKGLVHLLKKGINRFFRSKCFAQFMQGDTLYKLLKNATYLCYIFVTISNLGEGYTVSLLGTLYLLDTFLDNQDKLLEQLSKTGEKNKKR